MAKEVIIELKAKTDNIERNINNPYPLAVCEYKIWTGFKAANNNAVFAIICDLKISQAVK